MGMGLVGAGGATGGAAAMKALREELLKRALLAQQQKQQEFENSLSLRGADRQDKQLEAQTESNQILRDLQERQFQSASEDRDLARAVTVRETLSPETFIPEDDPSVALFQKAGLSGSLRMAPATEAMGPDFQGPMEMGETPQEAQVGRVRGRLTVPTAKQAEAATDNARQAQQAEAAQRNQEGMLDIRQQLADIAQQRADTPSAGRESLADFEEKEKIKAKYSGSRPSLGAERQTLSYYNRAKQASDDIGGLEEQMAQAGLGSQLQQQYAPNMLQTDTQQTYRQAQRAFTEARLRKESGAAIPVAEYENDAKTYFAQPGDSPKVIEQKRRARAVVLEGLKFASGKAFDEFYGGQEATNAAGKPSAADLIKKYGGGGAR